VFPTALHAFGEVHEMATRSVCVEPDGLGVGWIVHFVPFHLSASGDSNPEGRKEIPSAVHEVGDVQDTPFRELDVAPTGLGVGWIVHFVPFHLSARRALSEFPTAVQAVWEVHDTPSSATVVEPGGEGGVGWILHFVPFHLSASDDVVVLMPMLV
jgi:maltooligosyltrehalose synthase